MSHYNFANSKLYNAIYILTVHEGDARRRLAAAIPSLSVVFAEMLPKDLVHDFEWAMQTIERGRSKYRNSRSDYTLPHIQNITASKVIKKLVDIQCRLESIIEDSEKKA